MESYKHKLVSYSWDGIKEYGFVLEVEKTYNGHYVLMILNQLTKQTHSYYTEFAKVKLEE
jgi:hypothetical protein